MLQSVSVLLIFKAVVRMTSNAYFNATNPSLKGDEGEKEESIFVLNICADCVKILD